MNAKVHVTTCASLIASNAQERTALATIRQDELEGTAACCEAIARIYQVGGSGSDRCLFFLCRDRRGGGAAHTGQPGGGYPLVTHPDIGGPQLLSDHALDERTHHGNHSSGLARCEGR